MNSHIFATRAASEQRIAVNERKAQTLSTLRDTVLPRPISGKARNCLPITACTCGIRHDRVLTTAIRLAIIRVSVVYSRIGEANA